MDGDTQITGTRPGVTRYPRYDAAGLGFEGYWYPVLVSRALRRRPVALRLFGESVMFFRDRGGVHALQDRCPHRGIRLSIGRQEFPGTFTCRYHGWTFDLATGTLVAALTDGPDSPLCGKAQVRIYPVAERAGLIWIYHGRGAPPPVETQIPEELLRATAVMAGRITLRPGDWRHAAENGFDDGHGKYLHRDSLFMFFRHPPAWVISDILPESGGWITRKGKAFAHQSDYPGLGLWPKRRFWKTTKGLTRVAIRLPGVLRVRYREWMHFEWYVPTEPRQHRYVQLALKHASGVPGLLFRLRYWTYIRWLFHGRFNDQDALVVELMRTPPEQLYRPDTSIIAWRKLCERPNAAEAALPLAEQRPEEQVELAPGPEAEPEP